ncbi:nitric oxide reductase activation protein NorD [Leptospira bandrabouensis]|uniref:nitric oxide reductase activation protein NorD n=1 Tax=Leptospira bandrabouensis TaxID=2484903 RepID=UPI001EE8DD46|nr:nitric oxide reductase [Leptospira bandrabouensis]MCG6144478.1 nitric oxide reductase [Leptospira bandrabouensis]MCG6150510.1 nitric oxide reductase [Leptospira bandrabouensis]MCG6160139.1 nitric oxide reductase [Leptospira bandrabouensis]MCG6164072.1 nitric oxide reductase [Leptospira bandrabouensis]
MEWDQFVFFQGHKLWKKIRKKFTPPNPYYTYQMGLEEVRILRYLQTLKKEPTTLILGGESVTFGPNYLKFPEEIHWFLSESISRKFVRIYLAYLAFLFNGKEVKTNQSLDLKKNKEVGFHSKENFFYQFRNFIKEFQGIRSDWKEIRQERLTIRKKDPVQHLKIKKLITDTSSAISDLKHEFPAGKDFISKTDKQKIKSKESKQKLDPSDAEVLEVDEKKIEEYTLGHNFEKIETVEEFDGQWRDIDGEEDMEEEEALQELNLKHIIRTEDPVHTTRSSESGAGTTLEILDEKNLGNRFSYPEWDYKLKNYKPNYCNVVEEFPNQKDVSYIKHVLEKQHSTLNQLKKKMMALLNQTRIKKRLVSGDNIDLDALVDRYADIKAKISPSESIYMNPIRDVSDMVLYFLVDLSLSTDSWIQEKRVLDVERESLLLFSECLEDLKIPFGIAGFYSRTRNFNQLIHLKQLSEPWMSARDRLGVLSPIGYTRVGPSLRHINSILKDTSYKQKWIILITDARPNDYDKYEGKYGIEDVNKAVGECLLNGIQVYTLAIGTEEKPTIPAMMRNASYQMLFHPERLLDSLQEFFRRAIRV